MYTKIFIIILSLSTLTYCAEHTVTSQIYMNIKQGREKLGQIVIGLFGNDAPKTVENFRHICLKGIDGKTYVDTKFHRIIKKFMVQGGDIISNNGYGSISIYGKYFNDENLKISHKSPGYVGMANRGPNTNGCQFYITTISTPWLDGKHIVFGKVLKGQEIIHKMESTTTDTDDVPITSIVITACGEVPTPKPFHIDDESTYTLWSWITVAWLPITSSFCILGLFHYFIRKLNMFC